MERSVYITLDDVVDIIRQGQDVVVHDAKTGEDVTAFILTQIILEEARRKNGFLSASLLHLMIRHGNHHLSDFFDNHLEEILKHFLTCKSLADEQFSTWVKMGADLSKGAMESMPGFALFQGFPNIFEGFEKENKDRFRETRKKKTPAKTDGKKKEK
jgi:polyhydroxyalkanoate synthesis repressor PhaR